MATAAQSTSPSQFLPVFRELVADALSIDESFVRLVAKPDPGAWSYHTGTTAAAIYLQPQLDIANAGAGRAGTPISQVMEVYIRTRSFSSQAGGNDASLPGHLDKELSVVNYIHLAHVVDVNGHKFIMPPRMLPEGGAVERRENPTGVIESVIRFRLDYVLAISIDQPA
jgi:hypothetical protein